MPFKVWWEKPYLNEIIESNVNGWLEWHRIPGMEYECRGLCLDQQSVSQMWLLHKIIVKHPLCKIVVGET